MNNLSFYMFLKKHEDLLFLHQKVLLISNSAFPLDSILNDIIKKNIKGDKNYDFNSAYADIERIANTFIEIYNENHDLKEKVDYYETLKYLDDVRRF